MARPVLVTFEASDVGSWKIERLDTVVGDPLSRASRLQVFEGRSPDRRPGSGWRLSGFTSNERYVERPERDALVRVQQPLGRADATCAALIPIRKTEAWWELTQDERRSILERRSHHIAIGLEYLPAVARRLHHARDLGQDFDFLTWFEYAPTASDSFESLVARLRSTEEWSYVEREFDIRLTRNPE